MKKFTKEEIAKEKAKELLKEVFELQHNDTKAKMIIQSSFKIAELLIDKILIENRESYGVFTEEYFIERRIFWDEVKKQLKKL